jgi:hypothetical protein
MFQPQADFLKHIEMRQAPRVERAVAVFQVNREAADVFTAFGSDRRV